MSYIKSSRMPRARWNSEDEAQPSRRSDLAQRVGTTINSVSGTAWALGALLIGAASAGAAYALRGQPATHRKRGRAKATRRRAAAA